MNFHVRNPYLLFYCLVVTNSRTYLNKSIALAAGLLKYVWPLISIWKVKKTNNFLPFVSMEELPNVKIAKNYLQNYEML